MQSTKSPFVTSGEIAVAVDTKVAAVQHVLSSRGIPPRHLAGLIRLYDRSTIAVVKKELTAIHARRVKEGRIK